MREHHVFIPSGANRLAATLTLPDEEPRALIGLFSGGGGAPRSFYNSMWTRTARRLAAAGFATVRVDWPGVGDSTGDLHAALDDPPVAEAVDAVRFAVRVTGAREIGLGGICLGGLAALGAAERLPECRSVAILKLTIDPPARRGLGGGRSKRFRRLRRLVASGDTALHRLARRAWWATTRRARPVLERLVLVRRRASVLILGHEAGRRLDGAVAWVERRAGSGRLVVEDVPATAGTVVRARSEYERFVAERLPAWFDQTLPAAPASRSEAMARSVADGA